MNSDETPYEASSIEQANSEPAPEHASESPALALESHDSDELPDTEQAPEAAPEPDPLEPLAHLPLQLTLRSGHLSITLDELRRLDTGSVLEIHGVAPGRATLCHGEQLVAEGELVDIEGRLGLQITRMATLS